MSNIKLFESKQIRSVWNEADEKWYFSVQDVVEVLTDSVDVKHYIKRVLSRDEMLKSNWGTNLYPIRNSGNVKGWVQIVPTLCVKTSGYIKYKIQNN